MKIGKEALSASGTNTSFYAMPPLIGGALGNWVSVRLVDKIYKTERLKLSRRLPTIIGFSLAVIGMALMPKDEKHILYISKTE